MVVYQHSQPGTLTRISMGISVLGMLIFILLGSGGILKIGKTPEETRLVLWIISGAEVVLCFVFALFHNLTVTIDQEWLVAKFGIGLVSKKVALAQIAECKVVRNSWIWGWGIRKIPRGWLYNVSGLDAVELAMKDKNRIVRIGTDEPEALEAAIKARISG